MNLYSGRGALITGCSWRMGNAQFGLEGKHCEERGVEYTPLNTDLLSATKSLRRVNRQHVASVRLLRFEREHVDCLILQVQRLLMHARISRHLGVLPNLVCQTVDKSR